MPSSHPPDNWPNLKLARSAASYSEGARCRFDVENVVGLPHCWQRDIIVRGVLCGITPVLKFVQRVFLCMGVDSTLQVAD